MTDLLSEILATLRHNKLRTALTGFAVSWGIFLLIVLLGFSTGLMNGMQGMFTTRDFQVMEVSGGWATKPYKGLSTNRPVSLTAPDLPIVDSRHGEWVTEAVGQISSDNATVSTTRDYVTNGYVGVYPSGLRTDGGKLDKGRFINDLDLREQRKVIVLHNDNIETLFGKDVDPVGKTVTINGLTFTVVGTYTHEWNRRGFIPYSTAKYLAGGSDTINRMSVHVAGINDLETAEMRQRQLTETLSRQHQFDPEDDSAVWIHNRLRDFMTTNSAMGYLQTAIWIIGLLTMLSGIVGVSNIMFVSVRERTHEIGVRRAIGARPASILRQIMLESVAITTLFGYVGIVLGVGLSQLIGLAMTQTGPGGTRIIDNPTIGIGICLEVTAVLIVAGALAGLFPALKSLKIKPVEALRDE